MLAKHKTNCHMLSIFILQEAFIWEHHESANHDPYLKIVVDELLFLSGCKTYSAYDKAPVDVKIKLLCYV